MASQEPVLDEHEEEMDVELERSGWEGSDVTDHDIEWLRNTHRIPPEVECWLPPKGELTPSQNLVSASSSSLTLSEGLLFPLATS